MGQGSSNQQHRGLLFRLDQLSERKPSLKYHGHGLFATQDIPVGTILWSSIDNDVHRGMMNDANFEFPKSFSEADLSSCLSSYTMNESVHQYCNTKDDGDNHSIVVYAISKGDEITRPYGLPKWGGYLWLHITGCLPFMAPTDTVCSETNQAATIETLKQLYKKLGFDMTITR